MVNMENTVLKNRIKENRWRLDLTQDELAQKVNLSRVTLGKFERGGNPDLQKAFEIAEVLGVTLTELFYIETK